MDSSNFEVTFKYFPNTPTLLVPALLVTNDKYSPVNTNITGYITQKINHVLNATSQLVYVKLHHCGHCNWVLHLIVAYFGFQIILMW